MIQTTTYKHRGEIHELKEFHFRDTGIEREYCFDDDPNDLEIIREWEMQELKQLSLQRKAGKLPQKQFLRLQYLRNKLK